MASPLCTGGRGEDEVPWPLGSESILALVDSSAERREASPSSPSPGVTPNTERGRKDACGHLPHVPPAEGECGQDPRMEVGVPGTVGSASRLALWFLLGRDALVC